MHNTSRRQQHWLIGLFVFTVMALLPLSTLAQEGLSKCTDPSVADKLSGHMQLNVALPGVTETVRCISENTQVKTIYVLQAESGQELSAFIRGFYVYFVWIVGILAVVMTMYAGIQWITAAGNASRIENAKSTMNGALIGLVLTLTSYLILQAINPNLVTLRVPIVEPVDRSLLSGGLCEPATQVLASSSGAECGEFFKYEDTQGIERYCVSTKCITGLSCLACEGEGVPFTFCQDRGYECGYYDALISLNGTLTNVNTEDSLKKIELWWVNPQIEANPPDDPESGNNLFEGDPAWQRIDVFQKTNPTEGEQFILAPEKAISLTTFAFVAEFETGGFNKRCRFTTPGATAGVKAFNIPYVPGSVIHKDFTFDVTAIYNECVND